MPESNANANATAIPTTCAQQGRARKRARVTSTLTEEQLQHKRNVDRKAQRAFRQRTKDSIDRLEQQIADLQKTAAASEARLEHELAALRGSNHTLVQCLEHISDLASSTVRSISLSNSDGRVDNHTNSPSHEPDDHYNAGPRSAPAHDSTLDPSHITSPTASEHDTGAAHSPTAAPCCEAERSPGVLPVGTPPAHVRRTSIQSDNSPQSQSQPQPQPPPQIHGTLDQPISYLFDHGEASQRLSPSSLASAGAGYPSPSASHQFANVDPDLDHPDHLQSHFTHEANDNICHGSAVCPQASESVPTVSTTCGVRSRTDPCPVFTVLPSHVSPTCPLDEILHNFMISQRDLIAQGVDICTAVGPPKPTVKALLDTSMADTVHPLCGIMSEVLSTFAHVEQPEKLAFYYLMHKTMRWQIAPSKESYTAMPTWLRPTVTQITVQHAAWIDNIPWPGVRDILIENPADHPFDVFSQYYSHNVSVNWHFDLLDAVTDVDNEVMLHSIFEKHVCNLKNWTVTADFQSRFPYMSTAIFSRD